MGFLKTSWECWLKIAGIIGDFQARVILSLFYFVIVLPFGLAVRLFADPLDIKGGGKTSWSDFLERARSVEEAKRQY